MKLTVKNICLEFGIIPSGWTNNHRFFHLSPTILIHRSLHYGYGGIMIGWLYWGVEVKWSHLK